MAELTAEWVPLRRFVPATGATVRQVGYWSSAGVFGDEHRRPGSGRPRLFRPVDVATARTLVALGGVLGRVPASTAVEVGEAMRSGSGRWLVVGPHGAHRSDNLDPGPAAVVLDLEAVAR